MQKIILILMLSLSCISCKKDNEENSATQTEIAFDKEKWSIKEKDDYPFRNSMLNNLVSSDILKTYNKAGVLDLLGEPTRTDLNYLFYQIDQKRLGPWPLKTKTLVIKFNMDDTVEWVKIHGN